MSCRADPLGVRVSDLKAKSSDLPILQFFSRTPTTANADENMHDIVEDAVDDVDDDEDDDEDECGPPTESLHEERYRSATDTTTHCPVCHKMLLGDNDKINQHIDLCLNGEMVRSTIKEEDQRTSPDVTQRKR